jgi:hypothetical protein
MVMEARMDAAIAELSFFMSGLFQSGGSYDYRRGNIAIGGAFSYRFGVHLNTPGTSCYSGDAFTAVQSASRFPCADSPASPP